MHHAARILFTLLLASCAADRPHAPRLAKQQPRTSPTGILRGQVVDTRGFGVPAAQVRVTTDNPDEVMRSSTADGEGFFVIAMAPSQQHRWITATSGGMCRTRQLAHPGSRTRVVLQSAVQVRGTVRDASGDPVAGTVVRSSLLLLHRLHTHCEARTDQHGQFTLAKVALGPTLFQAWIEGQGMAEVEQRVAGRCAIELSPIDRPKTSIDIAFDGLPNELDRDIELRLLSLRSSGFAHLPPPFTHPKARNSWRATHLPDRHYLLGFACEGYAFEPNSVSLEQGRGPHRIEVRVAKHTPSAASHPPKPLKPLNHLSGTILAPDKRPASHLKVRLIAPDAEGGQRLAATTCTDRNGYFAFHDLRHQTRQANLLAACPQGSLSIPIDPFLPGAHVRLGEHVLVPSATVSGVVRSETGEPVAGAVLWVQSTPEYGTCNARSFAPFAQFLTDPDGRFRFRVSPGAIALHARSDTKSGILDRPTDTQAIGAGQSYVIDVTARGR